MNEALRLAEIWSDYLPTYHYGQVARDTEQELRRLAAVEAQRDALLEACRFYASMMGRRKSDGEPFYMTALDLDCGDRARAAIAKAEENT